MPPSKLVDLDKATPHIEELLERESLGKGNVKMLERAVEWPISNTLRLKILRRMGKLVESPSEKIAIGASRVVVAADNVNVRREALAKESAKPGTQVNVQVNVNADERRTRFANLAQRLGINDVLTVDADRGSPAADASTASPRDDGSANSDGSNGEAS